MDPWTAFLEWLETVIVPNWGELISMLPFFLVIGVVGPILSLLALYHLYHFVARRRGRVRMMELTPIAASRNAAGDLEIPPNTPFCARHGLLYPATATQCTEDREELSVRCPVDGTRRTVRQQVCRACGTRYVLGALESAITVQRTRRPPAGGAAAA